MIPGIGSMTSASKAMSSVTGPKEVAIRRLTHASCRVATVHRHLLLGPPALFVLGPVEWDLPFMLRGRRGYVNPTRGDTSGGRHLRFDRYPQACLTRIPTLVVT